MNRLLVIALATLPLAVLSREALASFCHRPTPPRCTMYLMSNSPNWEFEDCRGRIERFRQEVQVFLDCQRDEQATVIRELNEEVRQFNACARDRFC
ncbi:hypothetical protein J5Y09_18265 [Roseomonas sp. PWR1]|uniref:YARHG domain-containing protein n=1 Tax=Roseomonas nitratireducens TaxID=2820810 RepID=A0ABS4AX61_9PROT|nr:hypothetical protein [Neoroseomonas nitratireducens]MBP0465877.1 hypothetical protein [Neoroseomonas nitratireducens]